MSDTKCPTCGESDWNVGILGGKSCKECETIVGIETGEVWFIPRRAQPPEVAPREPVRWFAEQMEKQLRKHDDRPGWEDDDSGALMVRLQEEMEELGRVRIGHPHAEIISEAADVANFAMMIADNARISATPPPVERDADAERMRHVARCIGDACIYGWLTADDAHRIADRLDEKGGA